MFKYYFKILITSILFFLFLITSSYSEIVKKIEIEGNDRISKDTIIMFSKISLNDDIKLYQTNEILKRLYETNFFKDISIKFEDNILIIYVKENPIIQDVSYEGIKSTEIRKKIIDNLKLRSRSSYNEILLRNDKEKILSTLKNLGYYSPSVDIYVETLSDNKVDVKYVVDIGNKSKIKRISFIGNKVFKDNKLRSIIISEEYKFWKFISGKKYLNQNIINLDVRLLRNYYLNEGFYNVEINSSFAKLVGENEFELIFNIESNEKFYFGDIKLELPNDYNDENFKDLLENFSDIEGEVYSVNYIKEILDDIDIISVNEQFQSVTASVEEIIVNNIINLKFKIEETEKQFVEKINIYGNNITLESVIRNQLLVDEGDPYNDILLKKSINNIKSLNFFRQVETDILEGKDKNNKIINITVDEKATGEIAAGAGLGTSGGTVFFSIKENNYLGKGILIDTNVEINTESVKGSFTATNPNYNNSNKSVSFRLQADETDRLKDFGYKSSKTGFSFATDFEYLKDLRLGLETSNFYEKIETDSTASARQKKQEGNYWDSFLNINFDFDKRNQKFKTSKGFRSYYFVNLPIISETYSLSSGYDYKYYTELYENNISSFSFSLKGIASLNGDDVKLSERLYVPSNRLRGFVRGKVGPKDGEDYIGGNFTSTLNFSSTLPQILENLENIDFLFFFDAANNWGVDYDSSIDDSNSIRSSIGIGVDWFTVVGPLNFSIAQSLTKDSNDKLESFRFNLGTTF
jgi:outer membrane protein insertion porin family